KKGVTVVTALGSFTDTFMRSYLKAATFNAVAPPATPQAELLSNRADVVIAGPPTAVKITKEFPGTKVVYPPEKLGATPFAYVVAPGDQIWLNYINLFVDTIKSDGRLVKYANKNKLGPIVAP